MRAIAVKNSGSESPPPSDAALAVRVVSGDPAALGALYDRYASTLLAVAFRLLMSKPEAEDVVHDVFLGLPEALRRYEERGSLVSWLKRVTVRVALSRIRHEIARPTRELDDTLATLGGDPHVAMDIATAVGRLAPSLRAILVLKEIEGYSHAEIAQITGISEGASKVRFHRAIRALRTMLEDGQR